MSEATYYRPQHEVARHGLDPRVPVICQMAATIYAEKVIYNSNKEARRLSVDEAFLLYGEVVIRLAENDK